MTDPGLNSRLRQRSRRAGIMIGISMALTIAVCVGSFSVLYASLNNVVSDFVTQTEEEPTATIAQAPAEPDVAEAVPTEPPAEANEAAADDAEAQEVPTPTEAPEPTETPEDDGEFTPDYRIDSAPSVNLRAGPGVQQYEAIIALDFETPLEFLDQTEPTSNPAGDGLSQGQVWMLFRTEDGNEGWIREIDVVEID